MRRIAKGIGMGLLPALLMLGCSAKAPMQPAKVYQEPGFAKPGEYHLRFFLDGQGTLAEYMTREKARNPEMEGFDVPSLLSLLRRAYPQLLLPVQPGVPLCNLETNFKHCRGIELLADFHAYGDDTVVLRSSVYYHVRVRLEGEHPNFFRAAKAQRDRGEFALPRHYYVGALVEAIQRALPILQEVATDYRKYIRNDDQEIEIELTLEASRDRVEARRTEKEIREAAHMGGGTVLSALPIFPFLANLTVSAIHSGGRTFWEVLKEEKAFDLSKRELGLEDVEFSYSGSFARNFPLLALDSSGDPCDILIRQIVIRLRQKEPGGGLGPGDPEGTLREGRPG